MGGAASTSTSTTHIRVSFVFIRGSNRDSLKLASGDTDAGFSHAKTRRREGKTQAAAVGGPSSTSTSTAHIRVHSWFKKHPLAIIRENPCSSVAKKTPVAPHPRTPVRGSPGFAASLESQRSQTTSTDSVASVVQKTFLAKTRRREGKTHWQPTANLPSPPCNGGEGSGVRGRWHPCHREQMRES